LVTPRALRDIEQALVEFVREGSDDTSHCVFTVVSADSQERPRFNGAELVIDLGNPKASPITTVFAAVGAGDRKACITLASGTVFERAGVLLEAVADSRKALSSLERKVASEAQSMSEWFSPLRALVDNATWMIQRTSRLVPTGIRVALIVAFVLALTAGLMYLLESARQAAEQQYWRVNPTSKAIEGFAAEMKARYHALNNPITLSAGAWLGGMLASAVVGFSLPWTGSWLFPRAEFAIGDGAKRHDQKRTARNFVLGSVAICGLILPLARGWLWGR